MTREQAVRLMLATFFVASTGTLWSQAPPPVDVSQDPPGTPIRRSIERIHKNTTPEAGPFFSVGYQTYLKGVAVRDLFKVDSVHPELSERTARFTHVEPEPTACLEYIFPTTIFGPLLGGASLATIDYPVMNTTAHARQEIWYDPDPDVWKGRDWANVGDFQRGTLVAAYDLIDETDAIDLFEGVGTGTAVAVLRKSVPITLPSGATLDFAVYGNRILAEFFFQAKPVPVISATTVTNALDAITAGKTPVINSRFRDSGIWSKMAPGGPLPPESPPGPCPPAL